MTVRTSIGCVLRLLAIGAGGLLCLGAPHNAARADQKLLNVSYDPTRELYAQYNAAFAAYWAKKTHQTAAIQQSHGGSSKQAQSVIAGLEADVVTLAVPADIDAIAKAGLTAPNWQSRLPDNSAPYTSTIVFLVRHGNPKQIHDWPDLTRTGVSVITPNPKTSGGARYEFLGAYGYEFNLTHDDRKAHEFCRALYKNVAVLDSGSRGSTVTFAQRGIGDVLLCFENEAYLAKKEFGAGNFDIVRPSISILCEPPVAVVDQVAAQHHTTALATAYLQYLYSPQGQTIAAENFYRPRNPAILKKYASKFPKVAMLDVNFFGGWTRVQRVFFGDGGVFDSVYSR